MISLIHTSRTRCARAIQLSLLGWLFITAALLHAQGSRNVELLGHLNFAQPVSDVWGYADGNGKEYALVGLLDGTAIVDVSDPSHPTQVAFIPGPEARPYGTRDIKTYSHYAYITTEGTGNGAGLQVVDMRDPSKATVVFTFDSTFTTAHNLYIDDGYAYVVGTSGAVTGFHVLDLSSPDHPVDIGTYTRMYVHDIYVRNDMAYASAIINGTLEILDVRDKRNLVTLASIPSPNNLTHSAWTTEDGNYVLTTDETKGGHLLIWDIRDLSNIELVAQYESGRDISIHNVFVKGNYVHISYYVDGYRVVDISDIDKPAEVGFYDTFPQLGNELFEGAWGVYPYAPSGNVYVSDMQTGLYVLRFDEGVKPGKINGAIVNQRTGAPVSGAEVKFVEANKYLEADHSGNFDLRIFGGRHTIITAAHGFFSDTSEVDLPGGEELDTVISLRPNSAMLQVSIDSVNVELQPGSYARQMFTVSNVGEDVMEYTIRDIVGTYGGLSNPLSFRAEQEIPWTELEALTNVSSEQILSFPSMRNRPRHIQDLETILEDPVGDVQNPPDIITIKAGKDSVQVTMQVVLAGTLDPDDFGAAISLDLDQDISTGLRPPFRGRAAQNIGSEILIWTFSLSDGFAFIYETPSLILVDVVPTMVDSNSFIFSVPLSSLNHDDGNMNVTGAFANFRAFTDWVPDAGHGILGTEPEIFVDAVWIRENPTRGSLLGGESQNITLDLGSTRLQPDTTYLGTILVAVSNANIPTKAIPVTLRTSAPTKVEDNRSERPRAFALHQNYPNPLWSEATSPALGGGNPSTVIQYEIPKPARVKLTIYNVLGEKIRTLVDSNEPVGIKQVTWDGRNERGQRVSSGVYLYRLDAGEFTMTRQLMLMK